MRDSIIFYRSFYEAINELPPDVQAKVYSAIFEYSLNFNEVVLEGLPKTIFTLIKPQLDANNKRFENGKKGGRKKSEENQEETKTEPKTNQEKNETEPNNNVNVNVNENNNDILLKKETKEEKEIKDTPSAFSFYHELLKLGAEKQLVSDWLAVRKKKKLTNTETALKGFLKQVDKSGNSLNDVLTKCIEKSWGGFEADWYKKEKCSEEKIRMF